MLTTLSPGGAWINKTTQKEVAALVDDLGLETYPQFISGKKVVIQGNQRYVYSGSIPNMMPHHLLDTKAWLSQVDSTASKIDLPNPTRSAKAYELDSMTVEGWTKQHAWTRAGFATADVICRAVLGVEPREISALWFFTNVKSGHGLDPSIIENNELGAQYLRFKGGTFFYVVSAHLVVDKLRYRSSIDFNRVGQTIKASNFAIRTTSLQDQFYS